MEFSYTVYRSQGAVRADLPIKLIPISLTPNERNARLEVLLEAAIKYDELRHHPLSAALTSLRLSLAQPLPAPLPSKGAVSYEAITRSE